MQGDTDRMGLLGKRVRPEMYLSARLLSTRDFDLLSVVCVAVPLQSFYIQTIQLSPVYIIVHYVTQP